MKTGWLFKKNWIWPKILVFTKVRKWIHSLFPQLSQFSFINKTQNTKNSWHKFYYHTIQNHSSETYFSPNAFLQNSAASAFVIRNVSPWKSPLGKMPFSSASMWLKISDSLVRFRLQIITSAIVTHKSIFIVKAMHSPHNVANWSLTSCSLHFPVRITWRHAELGRKRGRTPCW